MASTCVSHDALTGYTPSHDLTFLESQQRAPAIRGLLYKERQERQGPESSRFLRLMKRLGFKAAARECSYSLG